MNEWLLSRLACPRDKHALELSGGKLVCPQDHSYPVVDDIPIMLVDDVETTHDYIRQTLEKVSQTAVENGRSTNDATRGENDIDKFVQGEVPYTSGTLYFSVQHKLTRYPIPETRLRPGKGERLLDVGCNWGRWSIAAAKKGYK